MHISHKTGYLRYNMCGDDMAADFVRRIRCYGCDYLAEPVSSLQYNQYAHIQFAGRIGVCIPLTNHVLGSGEWKTFSPLKSSLLRKITFISFPSKWCRALCQKETLQKKLSSNLASRKAKSFSNVQNAAV